MKANGENLTRCNYKVITVSRIPTLICLFLLTFFMFGCAGVIETAENPTPKDTAKINDDLNRAEELFARRQQLDNVRKAIELLRSVRQMDNRNFDAAWKLSRLYYYLGKYSNDDKEKRQALKDGIDMGKVATRIESEKPEGYFWLGANLGENAKQNPLTGISALDDIREAMNKVIALDPGFQGASAYDALAQIELQTDLFGGSSQKAIEYLEKAISLEKDNSFLYLHLGEAYLAVKRNEEGKRQLEMVVRMAPPPGYALEHQEAVEEAKKVLQNRF